MIVAYDASVDCQPALIFVLLDRVVKEFLVVWVVHLFMHPKLVAGHIVRNDGQTLGERWVHPIDIHVYF